MQRIIRNVATLIHPSVDSKHFSALNIPQQLRKP